MPVIDTKPSRLRGAGVATLVAVLGLVALIAASTFVYRDYRRDIGAAFARVATGSTIARTACGPIEYAATGEGPPVLIVHGAGGGFDQGLDFGGSLARQGFRVIAMSRFGYLRTALPADASAAAQADAHACLLDALGIERAAIVGVSAGGPSSIEFAIRHRDRCRALVLLVPAAYAPRPGGDARALRTPAWTETLFDTALRWDFLFWAAARYLPSVVDEAILATPESVVATAGDDERARVATMRAHILPVSVRRLGLLNDAAVTSSQRPHALERITSPTLAISVADDGYGTYEVARYTAGQIAGARFVGYPRGGHVFAGLEREVVAQIAAFLK